MSQPLAIHWFRRDLRLHDNTALNKALESDFPVLPIFIFDREILDELPADDARVTFIHRVLVNLKKKLEEKGSTLRVYYGKPEEIWKEIVEEYEIEKVFTNHDYEPYAKERDEEVRKFLNGKGIVFFTFRDQVIFEKKEILTGQNTPYTVFTPYSKKWKATLEEQPERLANQASGEKLDKLLQVETAEMPALEDMGFAETDPGFPDREVDKKLISEYDEKRNFPAIEGTSRLSIHLRFGTVSLREQVKRGQKLNQTWLSELIWREFYMQILWNFPKVVHSAFREQYDRIEWRNNEEEFEAWCMGKTGYPLVDAGMRELNETGFMHNRVRMVTASFLTKHLLIDWRWGEEYFAKKLLDFELASNNGGWQWAAGSGTDAAPYFRIFNPASQLKKFDPDKKYVKQWVPEYGTDDYPEPIVDHKMARERCLETYKRALNRED